MPSARVDTRAILEALDPDFGGLTSGTAGEVWENLTDRGGDAQFSDVESLLERAVASGEVERVEREAGPPTYTRPDVLLRAMGILRPPTGS